MNGWLKKNAGVAARLRQAVSRGESLIIPLIIGFVAGIPVFLISFPALIVALVLLDWWASWAPCAHGVAGGSTHKCCEKCLHEKAALEANQRREREFTERERRIDALADELRESERLRLAESYLLTIEELRSLTPWQFECEIADMFRRLGFKVEQTPPTNDYGRDAILWKGEKKYLLECKKYSEGNVSGRPDIQKFFGVINADNAVSGFFVTTGGFTKEALQFAATTKRIELIDQNALVRKLSESKPAADGADSYRSMCRQCEDIVDHRLRVPRSRRCRNGHEVAPTLAFESLRSATEQSRRKGKYRVNDVMRRDSHQAGRALSYETRNEPVGSWLNPEYLGAEIDLSCGVIGYHGNAWTLRYRGETYTFTRSDDGSPAAFLDVIILRSASYRSKSWYEGGYQEGVTRPTCSSFDGVRPDPNAPKPQAAACALCPKIELKPNAQGRKGKDCMEYKRLAVLVLPTQSGRLFGGQALMEPVVLRVPSSSFDDLEQLKPDDRMYGKTLPGHEWAFITRIGVDRCAPVPKLMFRPLQALTAGEVRIVLPLRTDPISLRIIGNHQNA